MEVDFDKEIDAMLRNLARGNSFAETLPKSHLDADELSTFAENALPAKARLRVMEHLADCPKCRKFLANFASLTPEGESEIIHEEAKTIAVIPVTPWYRRLFAFPQLAYTMGVFALLLSGMVGYLVLQNSQNYSEPTVAKMTESSERPTGTGGASSEGDAPIKETYSNSANKAANVAMPAANTAANSSAPASNTNVVGTDKVDEPLPLATPSSSTETFSSPPAAEKSGEVADRDLKTNKDADTGAKKGGDDKKSDDAPKPNVVNEQPQTEVADNNIARQQSEVNLQNNRSGQNIVMPDGQTGKNAPTTVPSAPRKTEGQREEERYRTDETKERVVAKKRQAEAKPEPTKRIGERTFRSVNGIWTDTAYNGGSTTNVKRGTDEYKKLDSGLQNIANSLGGTVIIVWSGKNYKIQ